MTLTGVDEVYAVFRGEDDGRRSIADVAWSSRAYSLFSSFVNDGDVKEKTVVTCTLVVQICKGCH